MRAGSIRKIAPKTGSISKVSGSTMPADDVALPLPNEDERMAPAPCGAIPRTVIKLGLLKTIPPGECCELMLRTDRTGIPHRRPIPAQTHRWAGLCGINVAGWGQEAPP